MSIEDSRRKRLLRRFVGLERAARIRKVECDVFLEIKDAINNNDMDRLSGAISMHSGYNVEDEDILWFAEEVLKIFPEGEVLASRAKDIIMSANAAAAAARAESESGDTMFTTIKIKRSHDEPKPTSLEEGELAYSYDSSSLFIGNSDGSPRKIIGGGEDDEEENDNADP